jgi:hypothetical protein
MTVKCTTIKPYHSRTQAYAFLFLRYISINASKPFIPYILTNSHDIDPHIPLTIMSDYKIGDSPQISVQILKRITYANIYETVDVSFYSFLVRRLYLTTYNRTFYYISNISQLSILTLLASTDYTTRKIRRLHGEL